MGFAGDVNALNPGKTACKSRKPNANEFDKAGSPGGDYGEIYSADFSSSKTATDGPVVIFYGANGAHPKGKLWAPPGHGVTPQHVLQVNAAPISPGWANAGGTVTDDGTNSSVNVLPAAGKTFFRLLSTNGP